MDHSHECKREEEKGGGLFNVVVAFLILVLAVALCSPAALMDDPQVGGTRTESRRTEVKAFSDNEVLSNNEVRIFSPETNIYYNSGDTSAVVEGDRNVVSQGGQCWVSSAEAWGDCPPGVPAGSAVP